MTWQEFKHIIPEKTIVKIEPTNIQLGIFNFRTGNVDRYQFKAEYVRRDEDVLWNHSVYVYGIITYDSGASYRHLEVLAYTDSEELDKLAEQMRKANPVEGNDLCNELRKYW